MRRLLVVDDALVLSTVGRVFPAWHMTMVLVRSDVYGGSGGSAAPFSRADRAEEIGLHEMGRMRSMDQPFCAVCGGVISGASSSLLP